MNTIMYDENLQCVLYFFVVWCSLLIVVYNPTKYFLIGGGFE